MDFSINNIFGQTYSGNQARFRIMVFRSLGRGSKMKHFLFKFGLLNFLFLLFSKITIFAKFSKNHVFFFIFIDVWSLHYQQYIMAI